MNEAKPQACPHSKTMLCGEHYEWCPECGSIRRVGKFLAPLMSWQHPSYERLAGDQQQEAIPNAGNKAGSISANGSAASCEWVRNEYGHKCGKPANHRDMRSGLKYCDHHAAVMITAFQQREYMMPLNAESSDLRD